MYPVDFGQNLINMPDPADKNLNCSMFLSLSLAYNVHKLVYGMQINECE